GLSSLPVRGVYVNFENRGRPDGFTLSVVLSQFDSPLAAIPSMSVKEEVALELATMRAMGVNTITLELWSADSLSNPNGGIDDPPVCNVGRNTGVRWPQPTPAELATLVRLFD